MTLHNAVPEKVPTQKERKKQVLKERLLLVPSIQNTIQFLCCQKGSCQGPQSNS